MKANPYFKLEEFKCKCGKCTIPENMPPDELIDLLVDVREHYGKPVRINSGYRCHEHNAKIGGAKSSQHCFTDDTFILTRNGWKDYKSISKDDLVASLNITTDLIEFVPIDEIIIQHYDGNIINFRNRYIDICVTDKHRMLTHNCYKPYERVTNRNISTKWGGYLDKIKLLPNRYSFVLADSLVRKHRVDMICGGNYRGAFNKELPCIDFIKLSLAIVADGHIHKQRCEISFKFQKERKINEIERLLNKMRIPYRKIITKDGYCRISATHNDMKDYIAFLTYEKRIPLIIMDYPTETIREFIEYYNFFDGCYKNKWDYIAITTISKHNADILGIMAVLSGYRAYTTSHKGDVYNIKGKTGVSKPYFRISITKRKFFTFYPKKCSVESNYKGIVWCVNNRNTTLIVKRNNQISIQGNCVGTAADFVVVGVPTKEVYDYVISKYDNRPYGIAYRLDKDPYRGFVHCDTRMTKRARWVYPGSYDQIKK